MIRVLDLNSKYVEHEKGTGFRIDSDNVLIILDSRNLPIAGYARNEWRYVVKKDIE